MASEAFAYGLRIDLGDLRVRELPPGSSGEYDRRCEVRLAGGREDAWPEAETTNLQFLRFDDDEPATIIDAHPESGLRLWSAGYGDYHVAHDGREIVCRPTDGPGLDWERCLLSQALPLAALLQGLEPLHAGAVALDGAAVAISGVSGAGKSSVVAHLVANGAGLLSDDVLAVDARDGQLLCHPGPAALGLRHAEHHRLTAVERARLGPVLEREREKILYRPLRAEGALPLRALYVIDRRGDADELEFLRLSDAPRLLATSFNTVVCTPDRLRRQFEVAGLLAQGIAQLVRVPPRVDARALATAILARNRRAPTVALSGPS